MHNTDYQIEKTRSPVVLMTTTGERVEGDVFLQSYVLHRHGPEEVSDLLNGPEPFLAVRGRDGVIRFLQKERIAEAELLDPPSEDDARRLGAREACVELTRVTGESYTARIFYEVPTARPRLLDWLNRLEQRFILVHATAGPRLVNWRTLTVVRPLD
jgi:hypothetical protein